MKQTAVEWLIEQIIKYRLVTEGTNPDNVLFHKAKAMEKEQIMNANSCGFSDGINHEKNIPVNFISCEQYFNKTFKSE